MRVSLPRRLRKIQRCRPWAGPSYGCRVHPSTGLAIALAVLVVALLGGLVYRRRAGRFASAQHIHDGAPADARADEEASAEGGRVDRTLLESLGVASGTPLTLLQFSSAFCGPCRTTRVLCADVATRIPGVRHVDVDAESHLDAVRSLDIWRTPTVLLIDAEGRVRTRASGAPTRTRLLAAVAAALPEAVPPEAPPPEVQSPNAALPEAAAS